MDAHRLSTPVRIAASLTAVNFRPRGAGPAVAQPDAVGLLSGLPSPKGLTLEAHQNLAIGQGAFGA
ncbi:MAG: hypothetical protein LH630_10680, partial [Actinomycetia bacterium]|nr:hypothetical protein [Actinomycetes bacterium]